MRVLTIHGWGFCPKVFQTLEEIGKVIHHRLEEESLKRETQKVAEKIDKDALVVGWSLGATIAVLASLKNPPKGLVLIGATPHFGKAWKEQYIESFFRELEENFERKLKEFRKTVWGESICGDELPSEEKAVKLLKEFVQTDISEPLRGLNIPTVILHGRKDPITPYREAKKMLKLNPALKLITYDGGHFPKHFTRRDWEKIFKSLCQL
ncbi:MAG: hypothetical protein DSZ31_00760 [Gammaproteobacteria bacterium]|nr:MAG: hypothetical protein DSZ31_00760 [Gammaproteobacteria bacterium]